MPTLPGGAASYLLPGVDSCDLLVTQVPVASLNRAVVPSSLTFPGCSGTGAAASCAAVGGYGVYAFHVIAPLLLAGLTVAS